MKTCSFPDCLEKLEARGLCHSHYTQWYRGKSLKKLNKQRYHQGYCNFPNCEKLHMARGYCQRHYNQIIQGRKPIYSNVFSEMRRKIAIENWQKPEYIKKVTEARIKSQRTHPNKLEQELIMLIQHYKLPFKFVGNGEVILGRNSPDFININGKKQVIELFGDYWHNIFDIGEKTERYRQYGFSCLIVWESQLKQEPDRVMQRIKAFARYTGGACEQKNRQKKKGSITSTII